jgi:hypothetical protein
VMWTSACFMDGLVSSAAIFDPQPAPNRKAGDEILVGCGFDV